MHLNRLSQSKNHRNVKYQIWATFGNAHFGKSWNGSSHGTIPSHEFDNILQEHDMEYYQIANYLFQLESISRMTTETTNDKIQPFFENAHVRFQWNHATNEYIKILK